MGADFTALLQWNDRERSTLTVTHEWTTGSIEGPYPRGTVISDAYPWLAARLREVDPVLISNLDDFPREAALERERLERVGIHSVLWVPFMAADGSHGFVELGAVNHPGSWLEGLASQLGLLGSVFANAIERRRADLDLQEAYDQIQNLKNHLEAENVTCGRKSGPAYRDFANHLF